MSIDAAISAIDQIVELPELLMDPAGASTSAGSTSGTSSSFGTTAPTGAAALDSTGSTSATSSASDTEFANALAAASGNTLASSALGSSDLDTGADSGASSSPSLGESDDSALLSLMSSLGSTSSTSASAADPTTMTADVLGDATTPGTTMPGTTTPATTMPDTTAPATTIPSTTDVENAIATPSSAPTQAAQATGPEDPRIEAMQQEANSLVGKPYVYGGGHGRWAPQSGYDCSGFVSAVLHAGGYLSTPQDTTSLPNAAGMESGPGQYVTVYDRSQPGQDGHVIIDIDGQFYESGGESGSWGGGGGVEKISTPSASYLSTFNDILHPAGL